MARWQMKRIVTQREERVCVGKLDKDGGRQTRHEEQLSVGELHMTTMDNAFASGTACDYVQINRDVVYFTFIAPTVLHGPLEWEIPDACGASSVHRSRHYRISMLQSLLLLFEDSGVGLHDCGPISTVMR